MSEQAVHISRIRAAGLVALALAIALAVGVGGFLLGRGAGGAPAAEGVDAGFARDMQTHHRQAVELSFIIRDKTDDPALETLTYDIINSQAHQAGQMYGWLDAWGLSQNSAEPEMQWMTEFGHEHGHTHEEAMAAMGMATPEQIQRLRDAQGVEAERLFLELMITHHEGALDMAQLAVDHATQDEARRLAAAIIEVQTSETRLLREYLAERS
ncbi:MAG TPA: DUF305 domain-containing protein [Propionibacterium sp.]|jgi:uncharacterized protein (DUF305 family)|nr:DUF305 domain-containing protein [Propionibacterium sp.]